MYLLNVLVFLVCFVVLSPQIWAQSTEQSTETERDGNWEDLEPEGSIWSGGSSPGLENIGGQHITVGHQVTVSDPATKSGLVFAGVGQNSKYTFSVDNKLVIYGNVTFQHNAMAFEVNGTVIIFGDLKLDKALVINTNGTLVVTGDFNMAGNNTNQVDYDGNGTVYADSYSGNAEDEIPGDGENTDQQQYLEDLLIDKDTASELQDIIDIIIEENPELLPVTLRNFRHAVNGKNVLLQWATETEINFEFFEIQRAGIDELFTTIGTVPGHGNSKTTKHYSWGDESPLIGINYYRLVSNDYDGYREVFDPIVVIHEPEHFEINIYPNPVETGNRLWFSGSQTTKEVSMYMMDGSIVLDKEIVKDYLDIPEWLSPGIYLLSLNINGLRKQQKIIVK